jgi:ABC-type polysaccharide/polyol phosphate transport system ATPase subunit
MSTSEFSLEVEGLSKSYRMYHSPFRRVTEVLSRGRIKGHQEFTALKDVNFKMKPGTSLGLCGANGAGKSTLLKVLAGTTAPSEGRYRMNGRVASLLELGAGFHLDFTGRANIFMNGIMMGYSRREMASKMEEIIDFAELGPYIDEPVRTYSSGMGLRLGFSVAVAVDPDILIIDEVFAVGDMYFQKKCIDRIYEFKKRGKTILFCSHSLYDIRQLCDDAIWLKNGNVASIGSSVHTTNEYTSFQRDHIGREGESLSDEYPDLPSGGKNGKALPRILDARMYRIGSDEEAYEINPGDSIELRVWWDNPHPEETPINIGVGILRQDMTTCAGMGTHLDHVTVDGTKGCTVLQIPDVRLLAGQFLIPVLLMDGEGVHKYQEFLMPENLVVRNETKELGLFRMNHGWEHRPNLPAPEPKPLEPGEE